MTLSAHSVTFLGESGSMAQHASRLIPSQEVGVIPVWNERQIRQNERRRILEALRAHEDVEDIASLQQLLVEIRDAARAKDDRLHEQNKRSDVRRLALLCGALLVVLEADDEDDVVEGTSQIDRWLGAA